MKKGMITITVVLMSLVAVAGSGNFKKSMKENLQTLRTESEDVNYKQLGNEFAEIAADNSNKFEPLYYSAYSYIIASWQVKDSKEKIEVLDLAKKELDLALAISQNNDELLVLQAFYYQAMIMVNPQKYGQSYSGKANELLIKAQTINNKNPRAEFLLAQNTYYTPEQYGGGKDKALPLFNKAANLFMAQDTKNYLSPVWGEQTNKEMLNKCSY